MSDTFGSTQKRCRDCGEVKPAAGFWRRSQSPDGLALYCKPCFARRNGKSYRRKRKPAGFELRPFRLRPTVPDGMNHCPRCDEVKLLSDFGSSRSEKSGLAAHCKPCHNAAMVDNKARVHGSTRSYHLKHRYNLTAEEVQKLVDQQLGSCPICLSAPAAYVDHDHATGAVRAVLCFNCNGGLGQFKDRPDVLRRAADYLEGVVWRPTRIAPGVYRVSF